MSLYLQWGHGPATSHRSLIIPVYSPCCVHWCTDISEKCQVCRFPRKGARCSTTAIHTLEVICLLGLVLGGRWGTFVTALVGLAYSPAGCDVVNIVSLDPLPWVLQFKACFTKLASLLPEIPFPLLDRWMYIWNMFEGMIHRVGRWWSKLVAKNRKEWKRFICLCQWCNINKLSSSPGVPWESIWYWEVVQSCNFFPVLLSRQQRKSSWQPRLCLQIFFLTNDGPSSQLDLKLEAYFQNSRIWNLVMACCWNSFIDEMMLQMLQRLIPPCLLSKEKIS